MIDGSDLPQIHIANFDCCACEFSGVPKKLILCERFELQLPHKHIHYPCILQWWQKLCGGIGGLRRKVWTQTKILSPNTRHFVANKYLSRFTHFFEIFGQKKCLLGSKTVFLRQEVHYQGTCQKRFSGIRPLRGGWGYPPFPLRKKTFFFSH